MSKSKLLKTTVLAALIGLAGAAAVTPASAHGFDRGGRHEHSGWRGHDRHDFGWRHHHRHFHGWY
ncbi:MAG: hypothetical protein WDN03_01235 [Rhizomicrobium sp.]